MELSPSSHPSPLDPACDGAEVRVVLREQLVAVDSRVASVGLISALGACTRVFFMLQLFRSRRKIVSESPAVIMMRNPEFRYAWKWIHNRPIVTAQLHAVVRGEANIGGLIEIPPYSPVTMECNFLSHNTPTEQRDHK
jgi:hypothetical protein